MDKIIVVSGENFLDANKAVAQNLKAFDLSKRNVFFVPSGAEQLCEKLIFDVLKTPVFFGVKICTIEKFLEEHLGVDVLSTFQQKLVLRKSVQNLSKNLALFNGGVSNGVVNQIFEEISRFEDAYLMPHELKNLKVSDKLLQNKISDLAEIYQEYLSLLGENVDNLKLKQKFFECDCNFENFNFFFINFLHFSKSQKMFLDKLSITANQIYVATVNSENHGNSYVFDDVFGEEYKIISASKTLLGPAEKISKLCFSVEDTKEDLSFLRVIEAPNPQEEIFTVASQIKKLLFEGRCKQNDITILCGNLLAYREELSRVFDEFGFDYDLDNSKSLQDFGVCKFIFNVVKFMHAQDAQNFQSIAFSEFSGLTDIDRESLVQIITKKGAIGEAESLPNQLKIRLCELNSILAEIEKQSLLSKKIEKIIILFNLEDKQRTFASSLMEKGFIAEAHKTLSALEKIKQFCLNLTGFEEGLAQIDLLEIFENFLADTTVAYEDGLNGGITIRCAEDFALPNKILFLLGANQGAVPAVENDTKILTDANIKVLGETILPVVKKNRLSRLRVLSNLTTFEEMLFISYSLTDFSGQKLLASAFVKSLCDVASGNILKNLEQKLFDDAQSLPLEKKAQIFAEMLGTMQSAKKSYIKLEKNGDNEFQDILPSLKGVVGEYKCVEEKNGLESIDKKALFFPDNKTKVSQIEAYYACPFRHFLAYGLKLTENISTKFMAVDTGNLLHKIAEEFLSDNNSYKNCDDVSKCVEEIFEKLKTQPNFEKVFYKENEISHQILKEEGIRLCEFLKSTQTKSNFKPKFLEVYFGKTQKFTLKVRGEDFSLVGIVDRVDVYNDGAVVIDYKTSSHAKGTNQELFYGEKIQIFVYAKAMETLFNLKPKGVFYFPIVNKFFDVGQEKLYMLSGKNVKESDFLSNFDTTLNYDNPKSKIFSCSIKTGKEIRQAGIVEYASSNNHEEKAHFEAMIDYAVKLVENAIGEILDANISVSPRKGACNYCPYLAICQKNKVTQERILGFDVLSGTFLACLEEGGENGKDTV